MKKIHQWLESLSKTEYTELSPLLRAVQIDAVNELGRRIGGAAEPDRLALVREIESEPEPHRPPVRGIGSA